jgi:uncharacterized coiled-coil DUF342 family protein
MVTQETEQQANAEFKNRIPELTEQAQRVHNDMRSMLDQIDECDKAENATLHKIILNLQYWKYFRIDCLI